ncbi:hypothetical protein D9V32_07770 [Mycetocola tolaasinivorans]|uniref:3-hydroxyacyl-CoA dehydrogenase n=1 Tax=Mycetocola tolaasinivorans TaxID=76635 RepID=A0A3L7A6T4_9MICO|nr:Rv3235 family protein [Mycetocola tolaasinivorans]RLP76046.1 hypothetical protein D9V32_07770 [Mycetocola tolaasinivorans]
MSSVSPVPASRPERSSPSGPAAASPPLLSPSVPTIVLRVALAALEVVGGVRDVSQLAHWISTETYTHLELRAALARRSRAQRNQGPHHTAYSLGTPHLCYPTPDVVEAAVVAQTERSAIAVAIRLERGDSRWQVVHLHVI